MRLPNRRPCETFELTRNNQRYHITIGTHPETHEVAEVFAYGPKVGSEAAWMLQDWCIRQSRSFQNGESPSDMVGSVIRDGDGIPASIFGDIIDLCASYEHE